MKIEFSNTQLPTHWNIVDLKPGQCFVVAGQVFVRVDAGSGYQFHTAGCTVVAVALDGTDFYTEGAEMTGEVYEIESITLRRVK